MKIFVAKEITHIEGLTFNQYSVYRAKSKAIAYEDIHALQDTEELHSELINITEITENEAELMEKIGLTINR